MTRAKAARRARALRILYVLPEPELNGGNKVVTLHAGILAAAGHDVRILGDGPAPGWLPPSIRYDDRFAEPAIPPQDLVIATFWTTIAVCDALALGPIAHFCQGYEGDLVHNAPQLAAIEAAYSAPHPLLAVTQHLAERIGGRFGRPARVASPVLDPRFSPGEREAPADRPIVLVPGIFEAEVKDVATALRAVLLLRERGLDARVVRLSILPLTAAEREILDPDSFLVGVAPEEVAAVFRDADLLLFPSRPGEGFGLPLLEAMAAGVPAVSSRIPSTEEMASDVVPLVAPGDAEGFADAAEPLLRDPARWRDARGRGLIAARRFAADAVGPAIVAAIEWAAATARPLSLESGPSGASARRTLGYASPTLDPEATVLKLNADPTQLRDAFRDAQPFPHIAIDGLFDDALLEEVLAEFPGPDAIAWQRFNNPLEKKLGYTYKSPLSPRLRSFLFEMNTPTVLEFLEQLTGIEGLVPDPYFGGAGPHQILPGGFLKIHADFNWHPILRLDRRLNLLVYLNKDWEEEYGGHLELWDRDMTRCGNRVLPLFNRTVVFATTDFSYHGHPHPLACPMDRSRKSVSLYYYTNGRPAEERSAPHDTVFRKTPGEG